MDDERGRRNTDEEQGTTDEDEEQGTRTKNEKHEQKRETKNEDVGLGVKETRTKEKKTWTRKIRKGDNIE